MSKEKKIKKVAVIGLGLIGGSLAKALKSGGYYVIGITKSSHTLKLAKKEKAIDAGSCKLNQEILRDADVVFIATPLSMICDYIKKISAFADVKIMLTDVGSTKLEICKYAKKVLPQNVTFIGGHPMAGNENSGFKFAKNNLFVGSQWVLTPFSRASRYKIAQKKLSGLIKELGAVPVTVGSDIHDKAVALISHFPLLASIGLCELVKSLKDKKLQKLATLLASSGFKDTTRIAGGNPCLSEDLISSNIKELSALLSSYSKILVKILGLARHDNKKIKRFIFSVSKWRKCLYN